MIPLITFQQIRAGLRNPKLLAMKARENFNHGIRNLSYSFVMDKDWDILIILDGCRYDLFEESHSLEGTLKSVVSPASCTRQWLQKNFPSTYPDTVYVSANPQTQIHEIEDRFFQAARVWHDS